MKAAFYTFGCKVNQYETQSLIGAFGAAGFSVCGIEEECDVYVVNSCTVTAEGDAKVRKLLRRLRREHPRALLALTGCYAQAFPGIAALVPEADVITGARNRGALLPAVQKALAQPGRILEVQPYARREAFEPMRAERFLGRDGEARTRAFLKIQDGCERFCSYCIIPAARGPFRSKPLDAIESELRAMAANGYREVVLVGVNLSCYGDGEGLRLLDAVRRACGVEGIGRVRLSSLEPEMLARGDIEALAELPAFCPQFHLSLQSGCDATLARMNRHYTAREYGRIVGDIRACFENPAVTTDIMVGFPGETEEEFESSMRFCAEIGLAKAHVFAYSRRPGTAADRMDEQVDERCKARRARQMAEAARGWRQRFLQSQIGRTCKVLLEREESPGVYGGYSENYTPVSVRLPDGGRYASGDVVEALVTGAGEQGCLGAAGSA